MTSRLLRAGALGLVTALSAVGSLASVSAEPFRLGVQTDALSLDPIATSDNGSIWAQLLIYDQLVRPTKDGTSLEPGLAESWEANQDGIEYTFHLRDAMFSNGDPVTVEDVIASLKRAAGEGSNWARFFRPITGFEAVDAKTLKLKLDKPFTPLINNLGLFSASILPAKLLESQKEAFFEHPVGSGPFVLERWNRGERIDLAPNPHYWQTGKPQVDGAELIVVGEDNSRVLQLEAGPARRHHRGALQIRAKSSMLCLKSKRRSPTSSASTSFSSTTRRSRSTMRASGGR